MSKKLSFTLPLCGIAMAAALAPAVTYAEETPVAMVNKHQITLEHVQSEMDAVPEKLVAGRQDEIQKAIVERLIQKRLVMEEAEKLNITEDETYKSQLATLRENLIFNFVLSRKIEEEVTPAKLRTYYADNKDRFTQTAAKIRHILLPTQEEAQRVIGQLDDGADFVELAQAASTGPSATRGGDLGWVSPGEMVPRFEDAAFDLAAGEYSEAPVKTQFGWHVIYVEDKEDNRTTPFNEVEERLQQELSEKVVQDYLDELEEKAEIEYEAN